jgi:DNA polymerase III subunit epsilon
MREIVLDTETTGFKPEEGHRLVEIGCLELINHLPTGKTFHQYLNPEREVPADATRVHGLTNEFLADKPKFDEVADAFLAFIGDAPLVIHNATFDMSFINAELFQSGRKPLPKDRAIDTLTMARRMFPGSPASLDALCKRFNVDNSGRKFHGALLDSELLAEVYLELKGGRQAGLSLAQEAKPGAVQVSVTTGKPQRAYRSPRPHAPTAEEAAAHEKMVAGMKTAIWRDG